MIQNVLRHLDGISAYGVVSICLFFAVFAAMLLWAGLARKEHMNAMRQLPLDDGESNPKSETRNPQSR